MEKSKQYVRYRFTTETIREAVKVFDELIPEDTTPGNFLRSVAVDDEVWKVNSDDEFFAKYRKVSKSATFNKAALQGNIVVARLWIYYSTVGFPNTTVTVEHENAAKIEEIFAVFERNLDGARLPAPVKPATPPVGPTIFIGHGHSTQWRDLKDHLVDKQGYKVIAYEVGNEPGIPFAIFSRSF
jgi:hypothetical protein